MPRPAGWRRLRSRLPCASVLAGTRAHLCVRQALGVDEKSIDQALNSDNPSEGLVELYWQHVSATLIQALGRGCMVRLRMLAGSDIYPSTTPPLSSPAEVKERTRRALLARLYQSKLGDLWRQALAGVVQWRCARGSSRQGLARPRR